LKVRLKEEFIFFRFGKNEEKMEIYRTCKDPHHAKGITFDVKQGTTDAGYVVKAVQEFPLRPREVDRIAQFCAEMINETLAKNRRSRPRPRPQTPPSEGSDSNSDADPDADPDAAPTSEQAQKLARLQSAIAAIKTLQSCHLLAVENMQVLDGLAEDQDISTSA
jgi:hypothetical protein